MKENKEYLEQGVLLHKRILTYLYEIQSLERLVSLVEMKLADCGEDGKKASDMILSQVKDTIADLTGKLERSLKFLPELLDVIDGVKDLQQWEVLSCRYIYGMDWSEIENTTGMEFNRISYVYREALKKIKIPANATMI